MAQAQRINRENEPVADTADADREAWLSAAATRKYRIEDGQVWSGSGGLLFPIPAIPGFSLLPESVRPLVFQSTAQFITNRVGQTAEGNVVEAVAKAARGEEIPGSRDNDAFESLYRSDVVERIKARKPDATAKQIEDTITAYREKLFAGVVAAGKEAALNKPTKDRKGPARKKGPAEVLDLEIAE